jgi:hypothetical protein
LKEYEKIVGVNNEYNSKSEAGKARYLGKGPCS